MWVALWVEMSVEYWVGEKAGWSAAQWVVGMAVTTVVYWAGRSVDQLAAGKAAQKADARVERSVDHSVDDSAESSVVLSAVMMAAWSVN